MPQPGDFMRPSLLFAHDGDGGVVDLTLTEEESRDADRALVEEALGDVDREVLYREPPSGGQKRSLWAGLKAPGWEGDWLATVAEEGQSMTEYLEFVTLRSGSFRPSHFGGATGSPTTARVAIGLCVLGPWPDYAPSLGSLRRLTEAYFDRPVIMLDPVGLTLQEPDPSKPGGFRPSVRLVHDASGLRRVVKRVRLDEGTGRFQVHVDPLLSALSQIRVSGLPVLAQCFCVMGITMVDLFSHPSDLFVAGMAAGGSNVAVFSFYRYHPCLKMSPADWHDHGYAPRPSDFSYYPDDRPKPKNLSPEPSVAGSGSVINRRLLFRAAKLLVHELMHIYSLDHCIHYSCIMNGTGHLVEDFAASFHLCPVCLRKMAWRLGFNVRGRYRALLAFAKENGWAAETRWLKRALAAAATVEAVDKDKEKEEEEVETTIPAAPPAKRAKRGSRAN